MSTVRSAARVAANENLDCYENLANAIVLQAVNISSVEADLKKLEETLENSL